MIARPILIAALLTLAAAAGCAEPAHAQATPYIILQTPTPRTSHGPQPPRINSAGIAYPVAPPTYAYGWFGVQPRRHWSRHFGYYRNYTQWTRR
jgi:hypothetical protein